MMGVLVFAFASVMQANAADRTPLTLFTEAYPPLNFMEGGEITGCATEVVREILRRTGDAGEIRLVSWEEGYKAVSEQPNTALYSTAMTAERKNRFQWVGPIGVLDTNFYARRGSGIGIATLDDARKVGAISVVTDYYSEQELRKEEFANLRAFADEETVLRKMLDGETQMFVGGNVVMPALLEKAGAKAEDVEAVFTLSTDLTYVAFSQAVPAAVVDRWQRTLNEMKTDGTFRRIYAKWLPAETPPGILQLVTEEYPPVTFMKDGKPAGFVTDMVREIAARRGVAEPIRLTSWKNAYQMARIHPNVVLFSAERTPERENLFQWVGPVGKNSAILYAKRGSGIRLNTLEEAKTLDAIATTTNWFTEQYLKAKGFGNLISSPEPAEGVQKLIRGDVQLSIFTDITIPEIVRNAGFRMEDLEPVLTVTQTEFYIALSLGTPEEVVRAWQASLDELKKDGAFETIYRRYLPHADLGDLL